MILDETGTGECKKCNQTLSIDHFYLEIQGKYVYRRRICKQYRKRQRRQREKNKAGVKLNQTKNRSVRNGGNDDVCHITASDHEDTRVGRHYSQKNHNIAVDL